MDEKEFAKLLHDHAKGHITTADAVLKIEDCKGTRFQNIVCTTLPIYDALANLMGWPSIPIPAFCSTPAPTPAPAEKAEKK